jgi:hypothetical protein
MWTIILSLLADRSRVSQWLELGLLLDTAVHEGYCAEVMYEFLHGPYSKFYAQPHDKHSVALLQ